MSLRIHVEWLPPEAAADVATMAAVSDLINEVYAAAEAGLWLDGATTRTDPAEVTGLVQAGQFAVARVAGRLAGCVRVQALDERTGGFGMLAAAPEFRGAGVGRELVRFAERQARGAGRHVMRLELLVPREWSHPSKEFLAGWYGRLGYRLVRVDPVDVTYPGLPPLLATTCDLQTHDKDLRNTRTGRLR